MGLFWEWNWRNVIHYQLSRCIRSVTIEHVITVENFHRVQTMHKRLVACLKSQRSHYRECHLVLGWELENHLMENLVACPFLKETKSTLQV